MTTANVEAPRVCTETRIIAADRLGQSYIRLVLAGPDLRSWSAEVVDPGTVRDAYVKILVPPPGGPGVVPDPLAIQEWLALPVSERGWPRTYTVRRADEVEMDGDRVPALTIDVVVHPGEDEGPGSAWARTVTVGDTVRLIGPGRGHEPWSAWAPAEATRVVCAGDETAVPALLAIASELAAEPAGTRKVRILAEVPVAEDARALAAELPDFATMVVRDGEPGTALVHALARELDLGHQSASTVLGGRRPTERQWQPATAVAAGDTYFFFAGEAGVVRAMRRLAVDGAGLPKESVAFMGYWRRGAAES